MRPSLDQQREAKSQVGPENSPMLGRRGLTLLELLLVMLALVLILCLAAGPSRRCAFEARRARCASNLNQTAKALWSYLGEHGDGHWLPYPIGRGRSAGYYSGSEWLATLYWTGNCPDPGVFICPASGDTNHEGKDLGDRRPAPTFGSQTVSYAGLYHGSFRDMDGDPIPARVDMPSAEPVASDDTEGTVNHGTRAQGGMNVLFLDGHVEFKWSRELDPTTSVGARSPTLPEPLLWRLRN